MKDIKAIFFPQFYFSLQWFSVIIGFRVSNIFSGTYPIVSVLFTGLSWRQHKQVPSPFCWFLMYSRYNLLLVHDGKLSANIYFNGWLYCYILHTILIGVFIWLHFIWCWGKPPAVWKVHLHVANRSAKQFLWCPSLFGCWFVDCIVWLIQLAFFRPDVWK